MAKKLMKGCEAIAEAAIQAGCRFFFGYPITPQNDIPEYMSRRMPQVGGCFLQAESELAAINMVYGAGGAGARADPKVRYCRNGQRVGLRWDLRNFLEQNHYTTLMDMRENGWYTRLYIATEGEIITGFVVVNLDDSFDYGRFRPN